MVTQSLDLYTIFVEDLAGDLLIFYTLAIIAFSFLAAKFRIPNIIFLILMTFFIIIMAGLTEFGTGLKIFYALLIFIAGFFVYYSISKIIKD